MQTTTLAERLKEVAKDQGIDDPDGRYFESLLGLTSGRVSQIFTAGASTKLGVDAIAKLGELGYRAEWINHGKLPKLSSDAPAAHGHQYRRKLVLRMCELAEQINDVGLKKALLILDDFPRLYPTAAKAKTRAKAA